MKFEPSDMVGKFLVIGAEHSAFTGSNIFYGVKRVNRRQTF
jgi:hypothetical protein